MVADGRRRDKKRDGNYFDDDGERRKNLGGGKFAPFNLRLSKLMFGKANVAQKRNLGFFCACSSGN